MINNSELKFRWIHETIEGHFDFLFEQGFDIASAMFTDRAAQSWQVMMFLEDRCVKLSCEGGTFSLGLSNLQICDQVGFLDLQILLQTTGNDASLHDATGAGYKNEEQQIKEISCLFRKYHDDIFNQFDKLCILFLRHFLSIGEFNQNGQLSMDNCPFLFSALTAVS